MPTAWASRFDVAEHAQDADQRQVAEQLERRRPLGRLAEVSDGAGHLLQFGQERIVARARSPRQSMSPVPSSAFEAP